MNTDPDLRTIQANPVLAQESEARREAFARVLDAPIQIGLEKVPFVFPADPSVAFFMPTFQSRLLCFVESHVEERAPPDLRGVSKPGPQLDASSRVGNHALEWDSEISTLPTLFGGTAIFPDVARRLRLTMETPSAYYIVTREMLNAVAASPAWTQSDLDRATSRMQAEGVLATSPEMRRSSGHQRGVLASLMTVKPVAGPETILEMGARANALYVLAGGEPVEIVRQTPGGERSYRLGFGAVFGADAVSDDLLPRNSICVRTTGPCTLLRLDREQIERLLKPAYLDPQNGDQWFRQFAAAFVELDRNAVRLVSDLRRAPPLASLDDNHLYALLQGANVLRWRLNWPDPEPIDQIPGIGIVLNGELLRTCSRTDGLGPSRDSRDTTPVATCRPGEIFGAHDVLMGQAVSQFWEARVPARVVFILRHRCLEVLDLDTSFVEKAREIVATEAAYTSLRNTIAWALPSPRPKVILFQGLGVPSIRADMPGLLSALATAIQTQFGETSGIVSLGDGALDGDTIARALATAATNEGPHTWLLVDAPTRPDLWPIADRVVFVHADKRVPFPDPAPRHVASVYTTILPSDVSLEPGDRTARTPFPPNRVRLCLAIGGVPRDGNTWFFGAEEDFNRWARAVTDRRVGVALGGGGSWGYAHLAVLFHLAEQRIPVDLVSGASFGAVVGAFYAAEGIQGLRHLLNRSRALQVATMVGFVTPTALEQTINILLGNRRLEDLVMPFFPTTTDLVSGSEDYVARGTLGLGVRASGGLSPMFPPTRTSFATWVDGGMSANVPARVLRAEGARVVFSSNVVPPPDNRPRQNILGGSIGQVVADLNIVARMRAAMEASLTAMATISEYSAAPADVQWDSAQPYGLPMNMTDGWGVVQDSISDPAFWDSLSSAATVWEAAKGSPLK